MVAKSFEVGDLVWAKMKGYSPWPGKIVDPPTKDKSPKARKSQHYVFFYGSKNYSWVADENICLHDESLVKKYTQKYKSASFRSAVEEIIRISKSGNKKSHEDSDEKNSDDDSNEDSNQKEESSSEKHTSKETKSSVSKVKRKLSTKKNTTEVKRRKRTSSADRSEGKTIGFVPTQLDDGFLSLFANVPPNIGYNGDSVLSGRGLLSRNVYVERPKTPPLDLNSENDILKKKDIQPTTKKIGFLGLGKMGQGIVKNLLQSGHCVTVWNRTSEKCHPFKAIGAEVASTPADVVAASDIIFCCVSDTDAAKALIYENFGVLKGLEGCNSENKGYVEMTSMDPKTSLTIADEIRHKGGRYLEAPLNGSRLQAIDGTLFIIGSGDKTLFEECQTCFRAIARHTMFLGSEIGAATKFTIVQSMLVGTMYAALAESLALIKRNNLPELEFLKTLQYGPLDKEAICEKGRAMVNKTYTSKTPLKHVQKDLNLGLMLGASVEQPLPIFAATNEAYKHLKLLRYADHDVSAVYEGTGR